jgi:hypothetical protein
VKYVDREPAVVHCAGGGCAKHARIWCVARAERPRDIWEHVGGKAEEAGLASPFKEGLMKFIRYHATYSFHRWSDLEKKSNLKPQTSNLKHQTSNIKNQKIKSQQSIQNEYQKQKQKQKTIQGTEPCGRTGVWTATDGV